MVVPALLQLQQNSSSLQYHNTKVQQMQCVLGTTSHADAFAAACLAASLSVSLNAA